jgi:hypothetical protein
MYGCPCCRPCDVAQDRRPSLLSGLERIAGWSPETVADRHGEGLRLVSIHGVDDPVRPGRVVPTGYRNAGNRCSTKKDG